MKSGSWRRTSGASRRLKRPEPDRLDGIFGALSDPIRRAMLIRLAEGECSVTALGEPFPVSPPAISKHLRVLQQSGLIDRHKSGRVHYCRLREGALRSADDWIRRQSAFWEQQFDALAVYLDRDQP